MQTDVRQLRYFVAVAEKLDFTRAAQRLNVVQQSLTSSIAWLEAQRGFALFERSSRAVALTQRGSHWLPYAREVLAAADRAQLAARELATGAASTLRVGLAATAAVKLTPALLRALPIGARWSRCSPSTLASRIPPAVCARVPPTWP
jgi:DNA-binding transcriptional LysR family regulator